MKSLRSAVLLACVLVACSDSAPASGAPVGAGRPVPLDEGCSKGGTGTLSLTAKGLPDGVKAKVTIEGPAGKQDVEAPGSLAVPGGSYSVGGSVATQADPIVRTVFTAASAGTTCVKDGATASVELSYAVVPSSGRIWMLTGDRVSGFPSSKLAATSSQQVESVTIVPKPTGLAFERDGSLWVAVGATLRHFPAGVFGKPGDQVADVILDVPAPAGEGSVPIGGIAFDASGNLWYSAHGEGKVRRISPEDRRVTGAVTKYLTLAGLTKPGMIAFDAAGNLWAADGGDRGINRFSADKLATNQDAPDLKIAPFFSTGPDAGTRLLNPAGMAFDAAGNLWAHYPGDRLVRLTKADLTNGDPTPSLQLVVQASGDTNDRIAFDESGGLWMTHTLVDPPDPAESPTFARFAPSQLSKSSDAVIEPERVIGIQPGGFVVSRQLAFYPAPAGLSIFGSVP
jgi:hypothetical protein